MRYSDQTKLIMLVIALIAAVFLVVCFAVAPLVRKINDTTANIIENKKELERILAQIQSYKTLSMDLGEAFFERRAMEQMFPEKQNLVSQIIGLEDSAVSKGLILNTSLTDLAEIEAERKEKDAPVTPRKLLVPGLKQVEEIPVTLTLTGAYRNYIDFFLSIENLPYFVKITDYSLISEQEQNEATERLENTGDALGTVNGVLFIDKLVR